jgi:hypothetical protein
MNNSKIPCVFLLGFVITILFFNGCMNNENPVDSDQINGSGRLVSESRAVGTFSGIRVTNFATVYITQDTVESLHIEADDNIIGLVATSVVNNTLVVGLRDGSYNKVTVRVYTSMKSIKLLESTGAADFSSTGSIQTDSLTCIITGAGTIALTGTTNYAYVQITGSGNIHNSNLISSICSIFISGAGSVEAHATQELNATIAGTGNITYAGNPPVVHQLITGIGVIQPAH